MAKGNGKGKVPDGPSGLGALFSKKNEQQAAEELNKGYEKGFKSAKKAYKGGFQGLKKDYASALETIRKSSDEASGYVTEGRDAALGEFDPYVEATAGAPQLYSDALGLGGTEGNARAVGAFQTGPGYDFAYDQGMQGLQRLNASRGRLDSGNTMIDAMSFGQGLANQEYGTWLDRLRGQQEFGASIAGGRAGIRTGAGSELAGIATNSGTQRAAIKTGRGDIKMGLGERLGDLSYATRLGQGATNAAYLTGLDAGAMNAVGTVGGVITGGVKATGAGTGTGTGGGSLGARLLGVS